MTGKQLVVFEQLDVVTADGAYAIASHNDINECNPDHYNDCSAKAKDR